MAGRFLLDTNIVIALLKGEPSVVKRLSDSDALYIPFVAMAELYYGAHQSAHQKANLARVQDLGSRFEILYADAESLQLYGVMKSDLRAKGRPIPEADIWIALLAAQHRLVLVSRDSHFGYVSGIQWESW